MSEVSDLGSKNTDLEEELSVVVNEKGELNESIDCLDKKLYTIRK